MNDQYKNEKLKNAREQLRKLTHAAIETAAYDQVVSGAKEVWDIYTTSDSQVGGVSLVYVGPDARKVLSAVEVLARKHGGVKGSLQQGR